MEVSFHAFLPPASATGSGYPTISVALPSGKEPPASIGQKVPL